MKCVPTSVARVFVDVVAGVSPVNSVWVSVGRGAVANDQDCVPSATPSVDTTPVSVTVTVEDAGISPVGVNVSVRWSAERVTVPGRRCVPTRGVMA